MTFHVADHATHAHDTVWLYASFVLCLVAIKDTKDNARKKLAAQAAHSGRHCRLQQSISVGITGLCGVHWFVLPWTLVWLNREQQTRLAQDTCSAAA